jgi:hypothetical protein
MPNLALQSQTHGSENQHQFARRRADDLENFRSGGKLFQRLLMLVGKLRHYVFLDRSVTQTAQVPTLYHLRMSRFSSFVACFGAPSHCLPQGLGQSIVAGQISTLEAAGAMNSRRFHSITSSAVASSDGGMVRPRSFAVLRLITSSNLVGCSMGKSPGFAPLRILST